MDLISRKNTDKLESLITKNPLLPDVEAFIQSYNAGLVNQKNSSIVEIVNEIVDVYKNVEHKNKRLIVKSQNEVSLMEIEKSISEAWIPMSILQREVRDNKDRFQDEIVYFLSYDRPGRIMTKWLSYDEDQTKVDEYGEEMPVEVVHFETVGNEKIFNPQMDSPFVETFSNIIGVEESSEDDGNGLIFSIPIADLEQVDMSFLNSEPYTTLSN